MNYALIEGGVVTNVIWLSPANASEFLGAVALGDRPVGISDIYMNGRFYRAGEEILTISEQLDIARAALLEIEEALNNA